MSHANVIKILRAQCEVKFYYHIESPLFPFKVKSGDPRLLRAEGAIRWGHPLLFAQRAKGGGKGLAAEFTSSNDS